MALKVQGKNIGFYSEFAREPAELLEDNNDASFRILDQPKLMKGFVREAGEEGAGVINTGSDGTVDESSRGVFQTLAVLMNQQ